MQEKRLLNSSDIEFIKKNFDDDSVYVAINSAYKQFERNMATFMFTPEEVFVNCFYCFDSLLRKKEEGKIVVEDLWNDIFCELRRAASDEGRKYEETELGTATSSILYSVAACLASSEDWELVRHTDSIFSQISKNTNFDSISSPLLENIPDDFKEYIRTYIERGSYFSDKFDKVGGKRTHTMPIITKSGRINVLPIIEKQLKFMKGYLANGKKIMDDKDYNKMKNAINYLLTYNQVQKQECRIDTTMGSTDLRYTFYKVYLNHIKPSNIITRELLLEFLVETFVQMYSGKDSLSKHFSDKPPRYNEHIGNSVVG